MAEKISTEIKIPDEALPYLVLQRGVLDRYKANQTLWAAEYMAMLRAEYLLIEHWLPEKCAGVLDVGAGLGGIDILISRHYSNKPYIYLLDGRIDEAEVLVHRETFSRASVTGHFQSVNGVEKWGCIDAANPAPLVGTMDFVISTAAWCFHFAPETYLDYVQRACAPGATLIVDVRKHRADWFATLCSKFAHVDCILESFKFNTHVFRAPA